MLGQALAARLTIALFLALALPATACLDQPATVLPAREGRTPSGLFYQVTGSGPPVVLVHGAMLDRRQWNPQSPLAERFTVIRYDTRWHGQSAGADTAFLAADDLQAVLDAVGVDRAAIVGLSNGARIAVDFALTHPGRIDRMVLVSPGLGGYQPVERLAFWTPMMAALGAGRFDSAAAVLASSPVMAVGTGDSGWVSAMVRGHAGVFRQNPALERQLTPPAISRLGEIETPTLVITGGADMRDIILTGDALQHGIAGARRVVLPGARHLLNISEAQAFNRILLAFLTEHRAR